MIYENNLESLILDKHNTLLCDELIIVSGFIGPNPVKQLSQLPIQTKVIFGMYPEELIHQYLHDVFINTHNTDHQILYSNSSLHSKVYLWRHQGRPVFALSGSANFTTKGLTIPFREILTEVETNDLTNIDNYVQRMLSNSIPCDSNQIVIGGTGRINPVFAVSTEICDMLLYNSASNQVPLRSGLNWGNSIGNTIPGDSYISILNRYIRDHPNLFPAKQVGMRQPVELIWDDGEVMEGLFEGSQIIDGIKFPKQISSFRDKSILGAYLRRRLNLQSDATVQMSDLNQYGRNHISISLLRNGVYYLDFSV